MLKFQQFICLPAHLFNKRVVFLFCQHLFFSTHLCYHSGKCWHSLLGGLLVFSSFKFNSVAGLFLLSPLNFCHQFQPQSSHFRKTISYFHTCKKLCKVELQMSHLLFMFSASFFFSVCRSVQLSKSKIFQWSWETPSVLLPRDLALQNKQVSQATWQLRFQG